MDFRDPALDPEQRCMTSQTIQKLNTRTARLSPQVRTLLEMYYKHELRLKDAAQILGISVATAKSKLLRARRKLRRALKQNECWTP